MYYINLCIKTGAHGGIPWSPHVMSRRLRRTRWNSVESARDVTEFNGFVLYCMCIHWNVKKLTDLKRINTNIHNV